MQTLVLIFLGIIIGSYIFKELHEMDEDEDYRRHLICIYAFGLLYFLKINDSDRYEVCKERLVELGLDEEVIDDPERLENRIEETVKLTER